MRENGNRHGTRARNVLWVVVWVGLGLALGLWVLATQGSRAAAEYYAAYFLEKSLSVDNIFVFVIIFSELHIPAEYQRRVLQFGIAGALVFRALLIGAGIALIERFSWVTYPFAALILFAAWRLRFGVKRERDGFAAVCEAGDPVGEQGWAPEEILAGLAAVLPKNIFLYVASIPDLAKLGTRHVLLIIATCEKGTVEDVNAMRGINNASTRKRSDSYRSLRRAWWIPNRVVARVCRPVAEQLERHREPSARLSVTFS